MENLTSISSKQATAEAQYSTAGTYVPSVTITDVSGNTANCTTSISVLGTPSVSVAATPSTSQIASSPITLTATPSNFFATPTYTFTTTEAGIKIVPSGNTAVVTATDGQTHNFYVTVTAKSVTSTNTDTAFETLSLQFTSTSPLTCTLNVSSGPYSLGTPVVYTVTGSQPVQLTSFTSYGKVQSQPSSSSVSVVFSTPGQQTVTAYAQSTTTGQLCNSGAALTNNSVTIADNLSCTASVSASTTTVGSPVTVSVTIPSGYAANSVQIVGLQSYSNAGLYFNSLLSSLSASVSFYPYNNGGSFPVIVTIEDSTGKQVQCTSPAVVVSH